jgi:hypothetical protein
VGAYPHFYVSSLLIALALTVSVLIYGLVSIPTFILTCAYFPALSFLWAGLNGADYISLLNKDFQEDIALLNYTLFLSANAALISVLSLGILSNRNSAGFFVSRSNLTFSLDLYVLSSSFALFFFWLTEPTFETIFSSSYESIVKKRIQGTQFSGGLALIFWLIGFLYYTSNIGNKVNSKKVSDFFFILVTIFGLIWFILHARRSELLGIGIVLICYYAERKSSIRASIYLLVFITVLILIGELRSITIDSFLANRTETPSELKRAISVVALPGGASNVFVTFLSSVNHFESNDYLNGATFINYFFQILPTFVYQVLGIQIPEYYYESVLQLYDYNGGTYIAAVFYANFGVVGMVVFGVAVAVYIYLIQRLLRYKNFFVKLGGLYLLAIVFRGFWYEMITIVKPILMIVIPLFIVFSIVTESQKRGNDVS